MTHPEQPPDPLADATTTSSGWQPLPPRARSLFMLSGLLLGLPFAVAPAVLAGIFEIASPWLAAPIGAVAGAALGAWLGHKRYRYTTWLLDEDGFSLRRGRLWRTETRVPDTRVQHLDLKRGPLERRYGLATLVIHTAGTKDSAVTVSGLDVVDAERLRDRLARQLDHDDIA